MNDECVIALIPEEGEDWNVDTSSSPVLKSKKKLLKIQPCSSKSMNPSNKSVDPEELFYQAKMQLYLLEKCSNGQLSHTSFSSNAIDINGLLDSINAYIAQLSEDKSFNQLYLMLKLLLGLFSEASTVLSEGVNCLHNDSDLSCNQMILLHECGNKFLIEWFHSFCSISNTLLNLAMVINEHPPTNQLFQIYHYIGKDWCILRDIITQLIYDLTSLSSNIFKKMSLHQSNGCHQDTVKIRLNPCICFSKLLLRCSSILPDKEHFWIICMSIVNSCLQKSSNEPLPSHKAPSHLLRVTDLKFRDTVEALTFCWWWIKDLPFQNDIQSCHIVTNRLLRRSLIHAAKHESMLVFHLICFRKVLHRLCTSVEKKEWKLSELSSFQVLWQTIAQHLHNGFSKENSCNAFNDVKILTLEWHDECKNLQEMLSLRKSYPYLNAFKLFLIILDYILKDCNGQAWLQMKERFFSQFQCSIMKQLSDYGMYNYISITIVIAMSCPPCALEDLLTQSISLLNFHIIDQCNFKRQKIIISGLYVLMHVCIQRKFPFTKVAFKVAKMINNICCFLCKTSETDRQLEAYKLFLSSLHLFCDLLRISDTLTLGQVDLLPANCLEKVLNEFPSTEASSILDFLGELFSCLRMHIKNNSSDLKAFQHYFISIIKAVLPWVKKKSSWNIDDQQFDDNFCNIACQLTFLCLDLKRSHMPLLVDVWTYFACSGQVGILFRYQYLNRCLSNQEMLCFLNANYCDLSTSNRTQHATTLSDVALQGWLKCSVLISSEDPAPCRFPLAIFVAQLTIVKELVNVSEAEELTLMIFLCALANKHKSCQNFMEKIHWSNRASLWFNPIVDTVSRATQNTCFVSIVYYNLGIILEYCGSLLFTAGTPSFVSRILNRFIINLDLKNISCVTQKALMMYLNKFIIACVSIGAKNFFINKVLNDIIELYLTRWPCLSQTGDRTSFHPFLKVLLTTDTCAQMTVLHLLYDVMKTTTETNKLAIAVEIVYEWLSRKGDNVVKAKLPDFASAIRPIRPLLRFNNTLYEKVNFLLNNFCDAADTD